MDERQRERSEKEHWGYRNSTETSVAAIKGGLDGNALRKPQDDNLRSRM